MQVNLDRQIGVAVKKIMGKARVARRGVARPRAPASSGSSAEAAPPPKKRPRTETPPETSADRPEAGADRPETGVAPTVAGVARLPRELVLMSFGARTLAQAFPRSPNARLLRARMWSKSTAHGGVHTLDEAVARLAVLELSLIHISEPTRPY